MRSAINRFHQSAILKSPHHNLNSHQLGANYLLGSNDLLMFNTQSKPPSNARAASSRVYSSSTRLAEVGRFESKQSDDDHYLPGQPFLHQIFGYRGVILFPWLARVHDIDIRKQSKSMDGSGFKSKINPNESHRQQQTKQQSKVKHNPSTNSSPSHIISNHQNTDNKDISNQCDPIVDATIPASRMNANSTKVHPYYQVLIDTRDCPFVSNRTQTEAVTFLDNPDNSKSVYSIKGLDYVAHEDILPYTSYEETPIHHELHGKLFKFSQEPGSKVRYRATDLLQSWQNKHPWLELSRVYRETTENIRITVIPFYLGHTTIEEISFHWWRYCVRLENLSNTSVQLRERHWKIFSQTSMLQTIKGRGVVGVEPILTKNEPAYQYSSHINLQDRSGHMWGTFKMQRDDGHTFECRIPPFSLESSIDHSTRPASKRD